MLSRSLSDTCRRGVYILVYKRKERTRILAKDLANTPEIDTDQRITRQAHSGLLLLEAAERPNIPKQGGVGAVSRGEALLTPSREPVIDTWGEDEPTFMSMPSKRTSNVLSRRADMVLAQIQF